MMKTLITILLISLSGFLSGINISIAGPVWTWHFPLPQGNTYRVAKIMTSADWRFCSFGGKYVRTTDAGNTWIMRIIEPSVQGSNQLDLYSMYFINSLTGFVCGNNNTLSKTTDAGDTWTLINTGSSVATFYSINFVNSGTGFASGTGGTILKSTNGGDNWTTVLSGGGLPVRSLSPVNDNVIYGCGNSGRVWKTTDGGSTWNISLTGTTNLLNDIKFIDEYTGYICGNSGTIRGTTDGGLNWDHLGNNIPFANWFRVWTGSESGNDVVYVSGFLNQILRSSNAGSNWTLINTTAPNQTVSSDLLIMDKLSDKIIAGGGSGIINCSSNGGADWAAIANTLYNGTFSDIATAGNNIFAVGSYNSFGGYTPVLHSSNQGQSWNSQASNVKANIKSIVVINATEGYFACDSGKVYKTLNGGNTWILLNTGTSDNISKVCYAGNNTIYTITNSGGIYKTTDAGINWTLLNSGTSNNLLTADMINDHTGLAGGSNYTLLKTNDGHNWTNVNSPLQTVRDIDFLDTSKIFISGSIGASGAMFKSTDAGNTWDTIGVPEGIASIHTFVALDASSIIIADNKPGHIESTTDGGNSWLTSFTGSDQISKLHLSDDGTVWLVGSSGNIMSLSNNDVFTLDLITFFAEGFYDDFGNAIRPDTVKITLRSTSPPYNKVDSAKRVTGGSGDVSLTFTDAQNGVPYYIVVNHRNSIETWSNTGIMFNSGFAAFDFSVSQNLAFGNNMKLIDSSPNRWGNYGGDVDQNGYVDVFDLGLADNDVYNFVNGYVNSDVTGDNNVDANDIGLIDNNVLSFVGKVTP